MTWSDIHWDKKTKSSAEAIRTPRPTVLQNGGHLVIGALVGSAGAKPHGHPCPKNATGKPSKSEWLQLSFDLDVHLILTSRQVTGVKRSCQSRSSFYNLRWTPSFPRVGAVTFLDWTSGRCWPKRILRLFSPFRFRLSARLDQLPSFHPARRPWSKERLTHSWILCYLFSPGQTVFGFTSSKLLTISRGIRTGDIERPWLPHVFKPCQVSRRFLTQKQELKAVAQTIIGDGWRNRSYIDHNVSQDILFGSLQQAIFQHAIPCRAS